MIIVWMAVGIIGTGSAMISQSMLGWFIWMLMAPILLYGIHRINHHSITHSGWGMGIGCVLMGLLHPPLFDRPPDCSGRVMVESVYVTPRQRIVALAIDQESNARFRLLLPKWVPKGSVLQIHYQTLPEQSPRNPGEWDPRLTDQRHKIVATLKVHRLTIQGHHWVNPIPDWMTTLRQKIIDATRDIMPQPYADGLIALTMGEADIDIPDTIKHDYTQSGLTHLLVVSGSQVALLIGLQLGLFIRLQTPKWALLILISISNLLFYCLCGGGVSIMRAIIMSELSLLLRTIHHPLSTWHSLLITSACMILIDPMSASDCGAQLSMMATASLLWGSPWIQEHLPNRSPFTHPIIRTQIGLILAPFIFTAPLTIGTLGNLSPISLLTNALALPIIELLVPIGFLTCIGAWLIPAIGEGLSQLCILAIMVLNIIAKWGSHIPLGYWRFPQPPPWHPLIGCLAIGLWVIPEWDKIPKKAWIAGTLMGIWVGYLVGMGLFYRPIRIICLDVGQGDSTLIIAPNGHTLLMDTGNRLPGAKDNDYAKKVILPALRYYGVSTIHTFIATHDDMDHIAGVHTLLTHTRIQQIIAQSPSPQLEQQVNQHIKPPPFNRIWRIGHQAPSPVYIRWLALSHHPDSNNRSICIQIAAQNLRFLFTGDAMEDAERELVQKYGQTLQSHVLHVGHHGSHSSSHDWFLKTITPQWGIISVGKNNHYGHPHPTVLKRLMSNRVMPLRTDQDGAIEWTIWPTHVSIRRWGHYHRGWETHPIQYPLSHFKK